MLHNPRDVKAIIPGALYEVPVYNVDNEGIHSNYEYEDVPVTELGFCKGVKDDPSKPRQTGYLTETLLEACKQYLETVNKEVPSRETSMAVTKIDEALLWLNKRQVDRAIRGVSQTMKP